MNKFGLLDEEEDQSGHEGPSIDQKISQFSAVSPRAAIDVAASDAAAAQHGFTSREPTRTVALAAPAGRRRRAIPSEPSRHLAIRLPSSGYDRFVAFADRYKLTYHDALLYLLDKTGE